MEKLVNAREAANLLGVCAQTIYQKFEKGEIPGYRLGKALRFDVQELKEFMRCPASASTENETHTLTGTKSE